MRRRRFLRDLSVATVAPLLASCAPTLYLPSRVIDRHLGGPDADRDPDGVWQEAVAYARWTPSPHNVQPWRVRVLSPTRGELLYDPTRLLPVTDPTSAFTIMGLAMFVEYLDIAMRPRGYAVQAEFVQRALDVSVTQPTLFATLALQPTPRAPESERQLLLTRQTSRLPYDGHPVDDDTMQALETISRAHAHELTWTSDEAMVRWVIDLNRFTLFNDLDDNAGRTELRRWIRTSDREAATKQDGLWSHCMRFPGWLLKAFFDEHEKWGRGWRASMCGRLLVEGMRGTRTVAWWSGPFATPADWIQAGTLLGRVWLELARRGIQLHPFGSIITNTTAYAKLRAKVNRPDDNGRLWLLVRVGRSESPPRSYRLDEHRIFVDT